ALAEGVEEEAGAERILDVGPNPARAGIQIHYSVSRSEHVRLELLDVSGRLIETLVDEVRAAGRHLATWDGAGPRGRVAPGLYFLRLKVPNQETVTRLAIVE